MKDNTLCDEWWNELNEKEFQEVFRMSKATVIDLQAEIDCSENVGEDRVEKLLLACIWILGNTKSFKEAEECFGVTDLESKVQYYFVKILKLSPTYIAWPLDDELQLIANDFVSEYKFPNLVGIIGSLHIEINTQGESDASSYFNSVMRKHTIVLQVVCDSNLLLRDVCVGCPGGRSIKEILQSSPLYNLLTDPTSALVQNDLLLLGGTEHPQMNNLLTPFNFSNVENLNDRHLKFNVLHNSVMDLVGRTFKCLEMRFPRLTNVDMLNPEMASLVASCICILHNFTRVRNDNCELYL